jgi:hypothetical protein
MSDEHTKELVMKSMVVLTMLAMGCSASAQMPAPVKPPPVQEKRTAQAQGTLDSDLAAEQARDAAGQARDAAGQARDAAGQARDLVGHARDVAQQQYRLVEGKKVPNDVNAMVLNLNDFRRSTGAMEKGTYAGISVSGVPAVVRDQLELPRGTGLVVDFVEPGSPAEAAGVKKNDVLQKLDEQILIDARQFQILVRMHKPDDEIHLTLLRAAKPQTIALKLQEREVASIDDSDMSDHLVRANRLFTPPAPFVYRKGASAGGIQWLGENGSFSISDDNGRHLVAKDKTGKVIFDGPIDTAEQMQKVPPEIRAMIKSIQPMAATQPTTSPVRSGE